MADAEDSKSSVGNHVRVQVPPSAPTKPLQSWSFLWSHVLRSPIGIAHCDQTVIERKVGPIRGRCGVQIRLAPEARTKTARPDTTGAH